MREVWAQYYGVWSLKALNGISDEAQAFSLAEVSDFQFWMIMPAIAHSIRMHVR